MHRYGMAIPKLCQLRDRIVAESSLVLPPRREAQTASEEGAGVGKVWAPGGCQGEEGDPYVTASLSAPPKFRSMFVHVHPCKIKKQSTRTHVHTHTARLTEAQIEGTSPKSQAGNGSSHCRSRVVTVT